MDIARLLLVDTPVVDISVEFPHSGWRSNSLLQAAAHPGHNQTVRLFLN